MDKQLFMEHCEVVANLVELKSKDYQGSIFKLDDYFPLGDVSYAQMLWVKSLRVMSLAQQRATDVGKEAALWDSLMDLVAYAVFYMEYLKGEGDDPTTKP